MGREGGMCKGPITNMLWEDLRMSSLCRGVSHKMLYFLLLRALDSTDPLSTFEGEGWLPLFQLPNSAHLSLPHHHLQGLNPKQDSSEPPTEDRMPMSHPKTRHFAHPSLKGGDHHCQARASSSKTFTSHLSCRNPSPVVTTLKSLPNLPSLPSPVAASCYQRLAFHAEGLSRPAAAHRTVTFTTPLIRQGYLDSEFYCFFTTGYLKDRILFFKTKYRDF